MATYQVELLGLQSVDFTSNPDTGTVDGPIHAKYYKLPSQIPNLGEVKVDPDEELMSKFALEERVIIPKENSIQLGDGSVTEKSTSFEFTEEKQRAFISRYYQNPPSLFIFCNSATTLHCLMTLPQDSIFSAEKVDLDEGRAMLYVKRHFRIGLTAGTGKSFGCPNEYFLSSGDKNPIINRNHVVQAIYRARITGRNTTGNSSETVEFGFIGEVDGIWKSAENKMDGFETEELVEAKCLAPATFLKYPPYEYEKEKLRSMWAQCRLRGISRLICGVIEIPASSTEQSETCQMKEIWLYDVKQIPNLVQKARIGSPCYPQVEFTSLNETDKTKYSKLFDGRQTFSGTWTEAENFQALFDSLATIQQSFLPKKNPANLKIKYFHAKPKYINGQSIIKLVETSEGNFKLFLGRRN